MSSRAAKQVTKRWNLAAAILIKMGFYSSTISMKEHFIIQTQRKKSKKSLSQNRKENFKVKIEIEIQKKILIYLFTSLQIDGDTIYQMVGTCEPQTQEVKFIIFVYL